MRIYDEGGQPLVTLAQAAELLEVTRAAVDKARARGTFPEPAGWLDARTPLWREVDLLAGHIPAEIRRLDRWVTRSGKVPKQLNGRAASSTDPATWAPFDDVRHAKGGLGFVLNGDGIICLDLDHCLDEDGRPSEDAARLLETVPATYVEVSMSGDGLHVFGRGLVERGRHVEFGEQPVEVYGAGRYIAVTGRRFNRASATLGDLSAVLGQLLG